ncbi:hypothetical protein HUJ04_011206 [Dendroctonus ponderosae]|nr:hypothetical protein HUJ04_011206 [Dendroctonus ponderosae]
MNNRNNCHNNEEYTDMHLIYGECHGNALQAATLYAERFPNRRVPSHPTFTKIHLRLRATGTFTRRRNKGSGHVTGARQERAVLDYFDHKLRVRFCAEILENRSRNSQFTQQILFTDEDLAELSKAVRRQFANEPYNCDDGTAGEFKKIISNKEPLQHFYDELVEEFDGGFYEASFDEELN